MTTDTPAPRSSEPVKMSNRRALLGLPDLKPELLGQGQSLDCLADSSELVAVKRYLYE